MKNTQYILALCVLVVFVSVCILGVVMVSSHHHQPGCPFMPGENVVCQMTVFEHFSAWKFVQIAIPIFFSLTALFAVGYMTIRIARLVLLPCIWRYCKSSSVFHVSISYNFYSDLFSSGILNPRIP